jgi:PRTRC genetic system protein C
VIVTPVQRIFGFAGITLPDIDRNMSPEEIKAAHSVQYPELTTAAINGPEIVGDKLRYEFHVAIGSKG